MVLQRFKYRLLFKLIALLFIISCDDYLDIVPDKTQELSLLFEREERTEKDYLKKVGREKILFFIKIPKRKKPLCKLLIMK